MRVAGQANLRPILAGTLWSSMTGLFGTVAAGRALGLSAPLCLALRCEPGAPRVACDALGDDGAARRRLKILPLFSVRARAKSRLPKIGGEIPKRTAAAFRSVLAAH